MDSDGKTNHLGLRKTQKKEDLEEENSPSPLAPVLNPAGKGLQTVLSPVGYVVGGITKPVGNALGSITKPVLGPVAGTKEEKMEVLGGKNLDSYEHGKDSLGGRVQSSDNPLGLDQSGKFGFREE